MNNNLFFAEITEGNLSEWTGQCWKWDNMPTFGSLLITTNDSLEIFGIVHSIKTGSSDPMRTPMPYQKTEAELLLEQPQIFEFLQTTFTCVTIGYRQNNRIFYHLPGKPPKIHAFVSNATTQQYAQIFSNNQFLHLLFNLSSQVSNIDELLLALFKNIQEKKCLNKNTFHDFIETLSTLYKNDYYKLKIFLNRLNCLLVDDF